MQPAKRRSRPPRERGTGAPQAVLYAERAEPRTTVQSRQAAIGPGEATPPKATPHPKALAQTWSSCEAVGTGTSQCLDSRGSTPWAAEPVPVSSQARSGEMPARPCYRISRNRANNVGPQSVRKLSGWNCSPKTGCDLWRMPIITREPSGDTLQAETSKASLSVSGWITRL